MLPTVLVVNTPKVLCTHKLEVDRLAEEHRVKRISGFPVLSMLAGVVLVLIPLTRKRAQSSNPLV